MIKGVHQLTLRPNMLISLTDHLQLSMDGWIDGQPGGPMYGSRIILSREVGGGGGGVQARRHTGSARHGKITHTHRQACECSCTGRRLDIHAHI